MGWGLRFEGSVDASARYGNASGGWMEIYGLVGRRHVEMAFVESVDPFFKIIGAVFFFVC